jgi:hypothetical protein
MTQNGLQFADMCKPISGRFPIGMLATFFALAGLQHEITNQV